MCRPVEGVPQVAGLRAAADVEVRSGEAEEAQMTTGETFTCEFCGGEFPDSQEDQAAADAEREKWFPGENVEDCAKCCDECWKKYDPATHPAEHAAYLAERGLN